MTGRRRSGTGETVAWWTAAGLYAAAIFGLSSQSHPLGVDTWPSGADKVAHAALYAGLAGVLFKALGRSYPRWTFRRLALASVALASLYGASDEWHQSFVPSRDMNAADWLADSVGAGLAQAVMRWRSARGVAISDTSRSS